MHKHMPIQIFSSAAIGFGYNTAREIAEHIKNNTTLSYFPLANTGPVTDVIAQEQAAAEFGLTPIYARTISVGDGGDYHLVILAKDDEARSWLNQQPERYMSVQVAKKEILDSDVSITVFVPNNWLLQQDMFTQISIVKESCDTVLLWDLRDHVTTQAISLLSDWCVIPSVPVAYLNSDAADAAHLLHKYAHEKHYANRLTLKGDLFYSCEAYNELFGHEISKLPISGRTMQSIFEACTTTPVINKAPTQKIDHENAERTLKNILVTAMRLMNNGSKFKKPDYQQRLARELELVKKHQLAPWFLHVLDVIQSNDNGLLFVRGIEVNCAIFHLLGISVVDPIEHHLPEGVFFSWLIENRHKGISCDFDCDTIARECVDKALSRQHRQRYAGVVYIQSYYAKSAFRLLAGYTESGPSTKAINMAIDNVPYDYKADNAQALSEQYSDVNYFFSKFPWAHRLIDQIIYRSCRIGRGHAKRFILDTHVTDIAPRFEVGSDCEHLSTVLAVPSEDAKKLNAFQFNLCDLKHLSYLSAAINTPEIGLSSLNDIPLNDDATFVAMRKSPIGLLSFGLNNDAMWSCFLRSEISTMNDLATFLAIYRPGASDAYLELFQAGTQYPMPEPLSSNTAMQQILKCSRGIPIFKEQFFEMLTQIAKFTDEQAFYWMENWEELKSWKGSQHFCHTAGAAGVDPATTLALIEVLIQTMRFAFSKGHSLAYATYNYMLAWLRNYHLNSWFCLVLNDTISGKHNDKKRTALKELLALGADVRGVRRDMIDEIAGMFVHNGAWYPYYSENKLTLTDLR